jgi:hypothetical protein
MADDKRIVEVRLLVLVHVNANDETFAAALVAGRSTLTSVRRVVSSEIASNLEFISYVDSVIVCEL